MKKTLWIFLVLVVCTVIGVCPGDAEDKTIDTASYNIPAPPPMLSFVSFLQLNNAIAINSLPQQLSPDSAFMTQKMQYYSIPEALVPNSDYQDRIAASVAFQNFAQAQARYCIDAHEEKEAQRSKAFPKSLPLELNTTDLQKNEEGK